MGKKKGLYISTHKSAKAKAIRGEMASVARKVMTSEAEKKYVVNDQTNQVITNTWTSYGLNKVAVGADYDERSGRIIQPTHLECRFALRNNGSTDLNYLRIVLLESRKGQAGIGAAALPADLYSNFTPQMLSDYRVHFDRLVSLNANITAKTFLTSFVLNRRKFGKARWKSASTTAVVPDDGGALQIFVISADVTNGPVMYMNSLLNYYVL